MKFDPLYNPYPSSRQVVYASNGMVATSQPLAAQVGLDVLKRGGNAIDAAVATAAALTVLEPTSNGIGGDAFALIWTNGKLYGLNSSGFSPAKISIEAVKARGHEKMPVVGWESITVPGVPAAWAELTKKFGKMPMVETLKGAIDYADKGYPISPILSTLWQNAFNYFKRSMKDEMFNNWAKVFAHEGRAPRVGEIWRSPDHVKTLQEIAETNGESFYRGKIAELIAQASAKDNGFLTADDLASFVPDWVEPIKVNYRGYDVWEIPPNGQGLVALMALNILNGLELIDRDSPATLHKQIEAIKLAFADGQHYITDPRKMKVAVEDLLSEAYAAERRKLITDYARKPEIGEPYGGGTVYLATADGEGNMVSFIQSNYRGFGSGVVIPGTGIALQNRGETFSLDPTEVNCLEPRKRTYHTIIPGFLTRDNEPVGPFGVMGGFMQPQGHVQVICNTIDFNLNPQAALDAPRWQWIKDKAVEIENTMSPTISSALARKGHVISIPVSRNSFGHGQIIWRDKSGVLVGGSESRTDGTVVGY